jgi:signal transduction histidine kinase
MGFAGMGAGFIVGLFSLAFHAVMNAAICAIIFIFASALMWLVGKKKITYRAGAWMIMIAVFMLAFPVLFFTAGGYRSGTPCFFVFALIFTAIMSKSIRERAAALALEFAIYAACCLAAYYYPAMVAPFPTEFDYVCDVILGITVSSVLLAAVVLLHIRMYHIRQLQIEEQSRELEARNETLTRYDRMKSDFLAAVAHEIKTPLDAIVAGSRDTVDLLEETPINTNEITDNQEKIKQRAMRIDTIVMDLMDTVAIESGRLALSRQLLTLSGLLKGVCARSFKKSDMNNNRLTYDFQPDLPPIWADPERMEQVMTNLISNAVRHTKDGVITIRLTRAEKSQTVSVTDNGEGMSAALSEVILKQYAPSTKSDYWRHGIGLFICRQIVISHGGEIWIESEKGRGTTVSFLLMEEADNE